MTSSNNVNIDLRPGTRLVRVTRGAREIMWVEDNTIMGGSNNAGGLFWGLLLALVFVIWGADFFEGRPSDKTGHRKTELRDFSTSLQKTSQ